MTPLEIRERAEIDLVFCIALLDPLRYLGACHRELIRWFERPDAGTHQLILFPRDHMKSAIMAYRTVQALLREPTLRVLYLSSTANLAEKQLGFMKRILESDTVSRYWPEHVNKEEGRRSKWTNSEIELDHPLRRKENIRDPSIFTAGLTTSVTGLHFDVVCLDDVVVQENAYSNEGRNKVRTQYSLISSIEGTDSRQWVVGTRYHPKDLYNDMIEMRMEILDREGNKIDEEPVYEIYERQVESRGDGTGDFLWPRSQRSDGKYFGFNQAILARKKAQYLDKTQFRAQYYNDPTDQENNPIQRDQFQYFEPKRLNRRSNVWHYGERRLNILASIDFAWSVSSKQKRDFTSIAIVGRDSDNNYYVLDMARFQTDQVQDYFKELMTLYNKWAFRKVAAETNAAGKIIVNTLKSEYIMKNGLPISIEEVPHTSHEGSKQERIDATLVPLYAERKIWHNPSGFIDYLEEELLVRNPRHDDCKDAVATGINHSVRPSAHRSGVTSSVKSHPRFGGRSF